MALATVAVAAGTAAAAAYIDARYHVTPDLVDIAEGRRTAKVGQKLAKQNKRSLFYLFEEVACKLKDQPCIWYRATPDQEAVRYTWTQAYEQSCRWGQWLLEQGVQSGELVGTYLVNSPEFVFNLLGSWSIGCAPAMINYNLGGDGLVHCLRVAGSKVLIVDEDSGCQERIAAVKDRIENELGMRLLTIDPATKAAIFSRPPTRPENSYRDGVTGVFPIFLFYTSGTTGFPKACPFETQRAYGLGTPRLRTTGLEAGKAATALSKGRKPDVWYDCMPLYHGTGCTVTISCLIAGLTLAIGRRFSVSNFWRDVHDSEANAFAYVGETARYLLAAPPSALDKGHKLKVMYGNGMRPDVWEKFRERFAIPCVNEFFNSTEGMLMLLNISRGPFHAAHVGHHGAIQRWQLRDKIVPVEIDWEKGDRIWRDPSTGFARRKSYEEGGEIVIKCGSEKEFVGYWRNAEATQKRFERDVFQKRDLYYRTGDALRRDRDGRWFFLDRLGDTFRWQSENVSTAEVAEVLGRFPGIVEANVYGVQVPGHDGRCGCAAVSIDPATPKERFDWEGLLGHVRISLPRYAVPLFVRVVASQTTMHNNKQNKVVLRKEGIEHGKIREGEGGKEDVLYWVPPGGEKYEAFEEKYYELLVAGKARL